MKLVEFKKYGHNGVPLTIDVDRIVLFHPLSDHGTALDLDGRGGPTFVGNSVEEVRQLIEEANKK